MPYAQTSTPNVNDLMPATPLIPRISELNPRAIDRNWWPGSSSGAQPRYRVWIEGVLIAMADDPTAPRMMQLAEVEGAPNLPAVMAAMREYMPQVFDPQKWIARVRYIRRSQTDPAIAFVWLGGQYERASQTWNAERFSEFPRAVITADMCAEQREEAENAAKTQAQARAERMEAAYAAMRLVEQNIQALSGRYQDVPAGMWVVRGRNVIRRARGLDEIHL